MLIRSRAYILDELAYRHQVLQSSEDTALDSLRLEYQALATLQAEHFFAGTRDSRSEETLSRVRKELETVDRHLGRLSSKHRAIQGRHRLSEQIGFEEVVGSLPPSSALVGFVRFGNITSVEHLEPGQKKNTEWQSLPNVGIMTRPGKTEGAYAAYVVEGGTTDPKFVYLGSAKTIESEIATWKRGVESRGVKTLRPPGSKVRELIWDPIASSVRDADLIFLVPDGDINHVSFDALPVSEGEFLCETAPLIHYLSAERDLVTESETPSGRGLLVVGGPSFWTNTDDAPADGDDAPGETYRGLRARADVYPSSIEHRGGIFFNRLPFAEREAEAVAKLWKAYRKEPIVKLTGEKATEKQFKEHVKGSRVIHVATHAFFTGEASGPAARYQPFRLSGMAFAGANAPGAVSGASDGILYAEEVAVMDLSGVEWVVLSACETGIGAIETRQGVLGLRRAFKDAGANTLIMSLWRVADDATQEWMQELYRARLNGASTAEAIRQSNLTVLKARRASGESDHPFFWAGFVGTGDWD
ncbi:MAG: CHAT domain-containing protein [Candidatus Eisenbacteria bacterium]|uniref:CHAT domain-containing protein n=1 Tax=Eiseniibacteriota bacterium TaxID=2212470 RepID=A0A7Y2H3M6_UNCEI|nr:CHAT domain-containing protein [Candidatus Eisenbacteria bacterium]